MHVCMCVHTHFNVYARINMHLLNCMHMRIRVHMHIYTSMNLFRCLHPFIFVYLCISAYMQEWLYVCSCLCVKSSHDYSVDLSVDTHEFIKICYLVINKYLEREFDYKTDLELKISIRAFDCLNITSISLLGTSFVPKQGPRSMFHHKRSF